jgi:hypothetical protein
LAIIAFILILYVSDWLKKKWNSSFT